MRKNLVLVIMTIMVAMLFFIPSQGMAQQGRAQHLNFKILRIMKN